MSQHVTPPPPPMPPGFPLQPPQPPQKRGPANAVVIGAAAAVIATIVAAVVVVRTDGDGEATAAPTVTVTQTVPADEAAAAAEDGAEEPAAESTEDGVYALDDTVTYDGGVEVGLSGFSRGVSGEYAAPENKPYVKFTVKVVNNGDKTLDATLLTVNCSYGEDGRSSEAIFDSDAGLEGGPETRLLAGRSLNVPWGCELPKGEKLVQIEVAPDFDSETAIFTGSVK